ncbi:ComC/BlpC family leader-containing pheromone/bacteriocin [Limosilactobacillus reuteri]|uniref:ComC/BlpC family leader-containing pheromone/bacteriocin n=1 Tax=Limosilactobacillus TaxID=2742598 RepID=UPI001E2F5D25|nr:ComC/BlpC family leader-containing pheromone/bacteriocin [Limosilactobacillus reuteri]MCC4435767.1 ComC/BlpC family leader-containing pheromone/bacteriocin [Limosilactobacillus reuteri]MCC4437824.1 ComC/BlpC family leader-containing pheromone/bacteriocin [Limosilactobacillus reuteri]MCC4441440.1 ComC/BlpC family leader-containing pheromone/bacteriocin [Limosilactobacillus reuteri]MCC4444678.1 ComC/BlpC family leader-containing pheromone/bacteriocin [Limosilactobacillus reuteri]MCC4445781.1 
MNNLNSINKFSSLSKEDLDTIYGGRNFWRNAGRAAYHVYDAINSYGNGILDGL